MPEDADGSKQVGAADENLPDHTADSALDPGIGEVGDGPEQDEPAEEEAGRDASEQGCCDEENAKENEQDPEGDGPTRRVCGCRKVIHASLPLDFFAAPVWRMDAGARNGVCRWVVKTRCRAG